MIRPVFRNAGDFILGANEPVDLSFYPNPAHDRILFTSKMDQVSIVSLNGETIKRETDCEELNLDKLKSGLYILILQNGNKKVSRQLIKQ